MTLDEYNAIELAVHLKVLDKAQQRLIQDIEEVVKQYPDYLQLIPKLEERVIQATAITPTEKLLNVWAKHASGQGGAK